MIQATLTIATAVGQRQGILQALRSLVSPTRVEPGCLRCLLYEQVDDPGSFTLFEEWSTRRDWERRLRSEGFRRLLILLELSARPPDVRFRMVSRTMGMEAIAAARAVVRTRKAVIAKQANEEA
jgi:quinol monooxygenase YgiN